MTINFKLVLILYIGGTRDPRYILLRVNITLQNLPILSDCTSSVRFIVKIIEKWTPTVKVPVLNRRKDVVFLQ